MSEDNRKSNLSLLVKPTHECNLNCKYCYEAENRKRMGKTRMTYEMIDHILKIATDYAKSVDWIWHGGEPTLMGVEWYRGVQEIFYKYMDKSKINQSMQSNGVLFNKEWGEFFRDYKVSIGFSYDGCVQDSSRGIDQSRIEKSVLELSKYKPTGGICVITNKNYDKMIEIYNRYRDVLKSSVSFNYVFETPKSEENKMLLNLEDFIEGYKTFFTYYINLPLNKQLRERSCDTFIELVFGKTPQLCTFSDCKESWLGINADGRTFTCDRILKDDYCYGNINDYDSIRDVFNSKGCVLFKNDCNNRFNTYCQDCGFINYCHGLCNSNHAGDTGSADSPNKDECNLFKYKFIATYEIMRDYDLYNSERNNVFWMVAGGCMFTLNEIKDTLERYHLSRFLSYDSSDILNCQEYKIFNLFNPIARKFNSNHMDCYNCNDICNCNSENIEKIRQTREDILNKIFANKFNEIIDLLGGEANE